MKLYTFALLCFVVLLAACEKGSKTSTPATTAEAKPGPTPIPESNLVLNPTSFPHVEIQQNANQELSFSVINEGDHAVDYLVEFLSVEAPVNTTAAEHSEPAPYQELAKGEKDPRQGQVVVQGNGGPDTFGYQWVDSLDPHGPIFAWQDISATGTPITELGSDSDDEAVSNIPIGFAFPFYGEQFTQFHLSSNGFISFSTLTETGCCSGQPLPNDDFNNHLIALMWADLHPQEGRVYYQTFGNDRFVLQFENYGDYLGTMTFNAQIILYDSGDILFQYLDLSDTGYPPFASIGIENRDGSDGLQVAFSDSYLQSGLAVLISSSFAKWLEVDQRAGSLAAGESKSLNINYRGDTDLGNYLAKMQIKASSDRTTLLDIPISMEVTRDITPPAAVSDLAVTKLSYSDVSLEWTAIANSKVFSGAVDRTELRYSTSPITTENWQAAELFKQKLSPKLAGEKERLQVTGLEPEKQYYFALLSFDQANNASPLSNVVEAHTLAPPVAAVTADAFTLNMVEGNTDSIYFTLQNNGVADLQFSLKIEQQDQGASLNPSLKNGTVLAKLSPHKSMDNQQALALSAKKVRMQQLPQEGSFSGREIIVRFAVGIEQSESEALMQELEAARIKTIPALTIEVWKLANEDAMLRAINLLNEHHAVIYAEPNYKLSANIIPNDPEFSELWGLQNLGQSGGLVGADIGASSAWNVETGNQEVIVAVIDTGIDYHHIDLVDNIWVNAGEVPGNGIDDDGNGFVDDIHGYNFVADTGDPMDDHNHGTHCAGTIGARGDNGEGVVGVNHQVRLMAVKFIASYGGGETDDAVESIIYAVDNGAHILSNSWGGGFYSNALQNAIEYAQANDVLFVAAAGNFGSDNDRFPNYPSNIDLDNVLAVAASDHNDELASFSQYGLTTVDIAAPGVDILSAVMDNAYTSYSGTSMATPHVAGVAALLKAYNSRLSAVEIKDIILASADTADAFEGLMVSGGRLSAKKALELAGPPWLVYPDLQTNTVESGAELQLEFGINSVNVEVGNYAAELQIRTNDPHSPQLTIPITLTITDDGIAPAAIGDLEANNTDERSTEISFTASGDDGNTGTAHRYDLRYAYSEINEDTWQAAIPLEHSIRPKEAGGSESITVGGLPPESTIWLAMRAIDFGGIESALSNVVQLKTLNAQLDVEPLSLPLFTVKQGSLHSFPVTLINSGEADIDIDIGLSIIESGASQGTSQYQQSRTISKGELDYRVGGPVIYNQGGPDSFSNRWIDSNEHGGPVFNWIDISETGTPLVGLEDDSTVGPVDIGFNFPFYGEEQSQIFISSNGFISFDNSQDSGCCAGQPLPAQDHINHIIAWLWYDLHPGDGSAYYQLVEPGRFVIQFDNYGEWLGEGLIDAQLILEHSGQITLQYNNIENNMLVELASIGIENRDGSDGLQVAFNTKYVENRLAVTFIPGWLSMDANQLELLPGESKVVNFTIDASTLPLGNYNNNIRIISNDIVEPEKFLPLALQVTEP